jgi:predicted transcriptional regulator of viral defense system
LLDIVVRPSYAGGVFEVLKAFRNANEQNPVSANRLSNYLSRIDYLYPYHQAIGFYLTAAGNYKESQIRIFKNIPQLFDFYLAYDMQNMEYSKEWRIYYPKGMI